MVLYDGDTLALLRTNSRAQFGHKGALNTITCVSRKPTIRRSTSLEAFESLASPERLGNVPEPT